MREREEELKARVRETPLPERLTECRRRIGKMCLEGRPPRMTIPVQYDDDDFYISTTLADAQATIADLQGQVEAAKAKLVDYETKTYCAFCGQTYLIDTGAELIARHIKECPKHPMRDVEQRVAQLEGERDEVSKKYHEAMGIMSAWKNIDHAEAVARLLTLQADHATLLGLVRETVQFFESNFENAGLELCGLTGGREITHAGQRLNELIEQLSAGLPAQAAQGGA